MIMETQLYLSLRRRNLHLEMLMQTNRLDREAWKAGSGTEIRTAYPPAEMTAYYKVAIRGQADGFNPRMSGG